ncbi:helix-turn-helix transcriptional regulator [Thalassotalea sp. Y01]|uniref:helix-turn-helix transcriptional regulator n=1 Tax=Thalassotalea sp. Y01 TaxID=2729613 RepID=UPI00145D081C|nr:helix-turn-helix transcriptional regulator [Thalassotalea sp. Y01]NMP15525.1 AraC family transcriptional regulator [Thalassotalea sp. Y01]
MRNIFFLTSWVLQPLGDILKQHNIDIEQACSQSLFPASALKQTDVVISWACLRRMFRVIEEQAGVPDLGFELVKKIRISHLKPYLNYAADNATTIAQTLEQFIQLNNHQASNAELYTDANTDGLWLCFEQRQYVDTPLHSFEQLMVATFIEVIRYLTKSNWQPMVVGITNKVHNLGQHQYLNNVTVEQNHSSNRVFVEQSILQQAPYISGEKRSDYIASKDDIVAELTLVLTPYLREYIPSLPQAALITGISERSIQRYLQQRQLSYRKFIEMLRIRSAKLYLKNREMSVADVAEKLHYTHYNNFSRAFQKSTGQSPSQYKKLHC